MKVSKEYVLLFIVALFLLAYLLDLAVEPLDLAIQSPYYFFNSDLMSAFPFSTVSIFIKALALFLTPLWLFSFFDSKGFAKPILLLLWSALIQLYAVQDVVTKAELVPLEWALSLTASGLALLIPTLVFFIKAIIRSVHRNLSNVRIEEAIKQSQQDSREIEI